MEKFNGIESKFNNPESSEKMEFAFLTINKVAERMFKELPKHKEEKE